MINQKQVVLLMAHLECPIEAIEQKYVRLKNELSSDKYDIYLILNVENKKKDDPQNPEIENFVVYDYSDYNTLRYNPISKSIMPGSCHFPILRFFLDNSCYSHYWFVEYDVDFTASWSILMDYYYEHPADFIASHIHKFNTFRNWYWWSHGNNVGYPIKDCYRAFHPICRYSNEALIYIDQYQKQGHSAHSELLIPTCLFHAGFHLLDMGGSGEFTEKGNENRFYISNESVNTIRYKPLFTAEDILKTPFRSKLFHPVKTYINIHLHHAIIIIAHRDFKQLIHLVEYFKHDCSVYIHIDKKADISEEELNTLKSYPQVKAIYRKYSVHWGGFSMLQTELFMLQQAYKNNNAHYYHLISGQDYPIKPLSYFLDFFDKNNGCEYIRLANIPNPRWDNYTFIRFKYFYPHDYITYHDREDANKKINNIIKFEKRIGIQRRIPDHFDMLYGSTQWFSITKKAVETLLCYTKKHKSFYRRARWTFAPEEYYVATVIGNLMPKKSLSTTDLRYIRWQKENGNFPAHLGVEHFHCIAQQNPYLFARKLYGDVGRKLIKLIDEFLLNDSERIISKTGGWLYNGYVKYPCDNAIVEALSQICHMLDIKSVLDVGCGAGFYVAALRRRGIPATGYDVNPHTPELSTRLLPKEDEPCDIADLTQTVEIEEPFDLVYCIDMLNQLPGHLLERAFDNLAYSSGRFILIIESKKLSNCGNYEFKGFHLNETCTKIISKNIKSPQYSILFFEKTFKTFKTIN